MVFFFHIRFLSDLAESSAANQSTGKAKVSGNDLEDFLPFEKKLQDYTVGSEVYGFMKGVRVFI